MAVVLIVMVIVMILLVNLTVLVGRVHDKLNEHIQYEHAEPIDVGLDDIME